MFIYDQSAYLLHVSDLSNFTDEGSHQIARQSFLNTKLGLYTLHFHWNHGNKYNLHTQDVLAAAAAHTDLCCVLAAAWCFITHQKSLVNLFRLLVNDDYVYKSGDQKLTWTG